MVARYQVFRNLGNSMYVTNEEVEIEAVIELYSHGHVHQLKHHVRLAHDVYVLVFYNAQVEVYVPL